MKKELLTLACMIVAGVTFANHWTPISGTQYNMTLNGIILIDGVEQTTTTLEVGAFCGEECRGSMMPEFFPPSSQYVVALTVVSNVLNGETITFRLYDHSSGQELNLTSTNDITFESNAIIGAMGNWYEFSFTTPTSPQNFNLPIIGYGSATTGNYKLIASPIGEVNPMAVTNMLSNNYDLYYFDQTHDLEWVNYKSGAFNLMPGKGYLYANSENVTLTFTGTPYSGDGVITLTKANGVRFSGVNLVGNPFNAETTITKAYYRMNEDGNEIVPGSGSIGAMEGIFVEAESDGETMTFTPSTQSVPTPNNQLVVNVSSSSRGNAIDRAIVRFGNSGTLTKFQLFENSTKLYIPQNNKDYAVVSADAQTTGEMPINFKAAANGQYTITVSVDGVEMNSLRLIDNMTGANIDLLASPSYSFNATVNDYESRFRLMFGTNAGIIDKNDDNAFAYFNGNEWVINITEDAILQVIDMNGRIQSSEYISGSCKKVINAPAGVYMLRLINGENVKVQKMISK